jgi:hypothetical protein
MRRSSRAAAARSCKNPHDPDSLRDDPDSVSFLLHLTSRLSLSRVPVGKIRWLSSQRPGPPEGARAGPAVLRTWSDQREASFLLLWASHAAYVWMKGDRFFILPYYYYLFFFVENFLCPIFTPHCQVYLL